MTKLTNFLNNCSKTTYVKMANFNYLNMTLKKYLSQEVLPTFKIPKIMTSICIYQWSQFNVYTLCIERKWHIMYREKMAMRNSQ